MPALSAPRQIAGGLALGAGMVSAAAITMRPVVFGMADPSAANTLVASVVVLLAGTVVAKAVVEGGLALPPACVTTPLGFLLFLGLLKTVFAAHVWPAEVELFTWIMHSLVFLEVYALLARHAVDESDAALRSGSPRSTSHTAPEERDGLARVVAAGVLATAAVVALYGVYQRYAVLPFLAEEARESVAGRALLANPLGRSRIGALEVFGPFVTANAMAGYLALLLPVALGLGVTAHRAGRKAAAVAGWATAGLVVYALFLTKSTGGAVAAAAGVGAAGVFFWREPIGKRLGALLPSEGKRRALVVTGAVLFAAVLAVVAFLVLAEVSLTMRVRTGYWRAALGMIADDPLGVGLGNFGEHYALYKTPAGWETREAHNVFLSLGAEAGLAAVVALLFLAWGFLRVTRFGSRGRGAGREASEVATVGGLRALGLVGGLTALLICYVNGPWLSAGLPGTGTAAEYLMMAVLFAVWGVVFWLASSVDCRSDAALAGIAGGVAAVFVHGLVDFTFHIKAIMFTSAALGAAGLAACADGTGGGAGRLRPLRVSFRGLSGFVLSTAVAFSLAFVLWRGVSRPMRLAWHSANVGAAVEWAGRLDRLRYALMGAASGSGVDRAAVRGVLSEIEDTLLSGAADGVRVAVDTGTDVALKRAAREFAEQLRALSLDSIRSAYEFLRNYLDEEPGDERAVRTLVKVGADLRRRDPDIDAGRTVRDEVERLRRLMDLSPVSYVPRRLLGEILAEQGHLSEAAAAFEKAALRYPEKPELWLRAGDARAFTDHDKAVENYARALGANRLAEDERTLLYSRYWWERPKRPHSPDLAYRFDHIDAQLGETAEIAFRRALMHAEIGGFAEAGAQIDRAIRLRPGEVQFYLFKAIFLDMEAARAGAQGSAVVARAAWDALVRMQASAPQRRRISDYTLELVSSKRRRIVEAAAGPGRQGTIQDLLR